LKQDLDQDHEHPLAISLVDWKGALVVNLEWRRVDGFPLDWGGWGVGRGQLGRWDGIWIRCLRLEFSGAPEGTILIRVRMTLVGEEEEDRIV